MLVISGESLDDIYREARDACAHGPVHSLRIHVQLDPAQLDTAFVRTYRTKAAEWQSPDRPSHMHFTHREYMNHAGDGLAFVIRELREKLQREPTESEVDDREEQGPQTV